MYGAVFYDRSPDGKEAEIIDIFIEKQKPAQSEPVI